jgi:hypothetical protein
VLVGRGRAVLECGASPARHGGFYVRVTALSQIGAWDSIGVDEVPSAQAPTRYCQVPSVVRAPAVDASHRLAPTELRRRTQIVTAQKSRSRPAPQHARTPRVAMESEMRLALVGRVRWRTSQSRVHEHAKRLLAETGPLALFRAVDCAHRAQGNDDACQARYWRAVSGEISRQMQRDQILKELLPRTLR